MPHIWTVTLLTNIKYERYNICFSTFTIIICDQSGLNLTPTPTHTLYWSNASKEGKNGDSLSFKTRKITEFENSIKSW